MTISPACPMPAAFLPRPMKLEETQPSAHWPSTLPALNGCGYGCGPILYPGLSTQRKPEDPNGCSIPKPGAWPSGRM